MLSLKKTQNIMKISAKYLSKKLFTSYAKKELLKGKTEKEIKENFTLELLNIEAKDFCDKNGFELID